ncbi:MAG: DUF1638 domain-containing protein [Anaerolineae bacterium]|jgi:hypothetical protein
MSSERLPIVVIACRVLQEELERLLPPGMASQVMFMDYGLHRVPAKMTTTLQEMIESIEPPSLVVLGYGLCGNGLKGLRAGQHTLLAPRTDDCIALLLGSYQAYIREFEAVPGTYYLTRGWLESGSDPLKEYEEYAAKYGADQAQWIMDQQYQHYERLMLVARSEEELQQYRSRAQQVARYCEHWGFRYEERLGSDEYVRRLVEAAHLLSDNGHTVPDWVRRDFVVVLPGDEIRQDLYVR